MTLLPTERVRAALSGRYEVEREVGRGGMATVFLARDPRHDRPVAVKVLHPDLAAVIGTERFLREVRITARLSHPHVLPLLDSGGGRGCSTTSCRLSKGSRCARASTDKVRCQSRRH